MAQTTYTVAFLPIERTEAICSAIIGQLGAWAELFDVHFVSIVKVGDNIEYTFTNPLPQAETDSIGLTRWDL